MSFKYPLFRSHIDLAHRFWRSIVAPGDIVVDATCGNGYDTAILAELALADNAGNVYAIDIQPAAIESCRKRLSGLLTQEAMDRVHFIERCHSTFPKEIAPRSVKLVTYNLGYLPGGDKKLTTLTATTLASLEKALELIQDGGLISITCYPGHDAGVPEESEVLKLAAGLDPKEWSCCHHRWINRERAPSLLLVQRSLVDGMVAGD